MELYPKTVAMYNVTAHVLCKYTEEAEHLGQWTTTAVLAVLYELSLLQKKKYYWLEYITFPH